MLAYYTGMRMGEILGLAWADIDLDSGTLQIRRQLNYISGHGTMLAPPKTPTSNRLILIDSRLKDLLKRWKIHQEALEMLEDSYCHVYKDEQNGLHNVTMGIPVVPNMKRVSLVCTDKEGRFIKRDRLSYQARRAVVNMHSFRAC